MIILSQEEIVTITHRRRYAAQRRALAAMGLECIVNGDGAPIVSRAHFEARLGVESRKAPKPATLRAVS